MDKFLQDPAIPVISFEELTFGGVLGRGANGVVRSGVWDSSYVIQWATTSGSVIVRESVRGRGTLP